MKHITKDWAKSSEGWVDALNSTIEEHENNIGKSLREHGKASSKILALQDTLIKKTITVNQTSRIERRKTYDEIVKLTDAEIEAAKKAEEKKLEDEKKLKEERIKLQEEFIENSNIKDQEYWDLKQQRIDDWDYHVM